MLKQPGRKASAPLTAEEKKAIDTVKEWADVQTQVVIDSELYSRVSKDYIK